jgi:predicted nucleic acid-binding protein
MAIQSVYIETSVVSYLTSRPSRDPIVAGHQAATHEWWNVRRSRYGLYVSELVITEASRGHEEAAVKRLALLDGVDLLRITEEVTGFAQVLIDRHAIPLAASADAIHVAIAAVNGMNYLLTWNCKHIANAERRDAILATCLQRGYKPPVICTPDELVGD